MQPFVFSEQDKVDFHLGIKLFNEQHFWHAHEAWEAVWRRHPEDERLFLQGLIQLAAAYHHYMTRRSYRGMINNLKKAQSKLELFPAEYCGIQPTPLLTLIENVIRIAEKSNANDFNELGEIEIISITQIPEG